MNKTMTFGKRILSALLALALVLTSVAIPAEDVSAASAKAVKTVTLKVDSKKVTKKTLTLTKGAKKTLKVTVKPAAAKKSVAFKSNKKSVATVSKKGVITAKKAGTAKITVTVTGKNKKKKSTWVKVKVTNPATTTPGTQTPGTQTPGTQTPGTTTPGTTTPGTTTPGTTTPGTQTPGTTTPGTQTPAVVEVQTIAFNESSYTVEKGSSVQSNVTITPSNATDKTVNYTSSDEQVATVTPAGIIFGYKAGTATITAKSSNGKTATATVTVTEPIVITLSNTELTIGKNQTANITASLAGVTWSSDNLEVATVDENGKVTGISAGVANIIATSGTVSASCKVTVTKYDPENDGVTLSVFNPIKNNADASGNAAVIENTVLVNQDMIIQAYVQKDATPVKGARVKLQLDEIDSYIVTENDYTIKVDGIGTDTATTNDEGIAEFTVTYVGDGEIESTYDNEFDCPYISFNVSTLVDNQPNDKDITVKFASVLRQGIQVDNNRSILYDDIIPFNERAEGDDGIQSSYNTNDYYEVEYVTSQQVGNDVYLSANPYFILPPDRKATEAKFEVVFPSKQVTTGQEDVSVVGPGATQSYTIYNDGADITTTTSIINVPEGLVSMSVFFNKISISKYSQLYVDLYEYDGFKGNLVYSKTYTEFVKEYAQEEGVPIENLNKMKGKGILIVSIQSPGQVDISTTGYSLNKVTGDFNSNNKAFAEKIEVINAVKWTDVTKDARYSVAEKMTYEEVIEYLPEYKNVENRFIVNDENYKFEKRIPVFNSKAETANAIVGNALITATYTAVDGTVKTATYAYPAVRETKYDDATGTYVTTNTNKLMDKSDDIKAIFLGYDVIDANGNIQQTTGGMTQNGNQAIIKSASSNISGAIFVEARLQIDALNKEVAMCDKNYNYDKSPIRGANNKYPLYSYVQFVAKPDAKEGDGVVPTFHAIEDQYIVVTGEVIASNGEVQTEQPVEFYWGDEKITTVDTMIGENVQVKYLDKQTNKDGKAYLVLVGHEGSYVTNLSAKYEGDFTTFNTYAGNQKFEAIKQGDKTKNVCDLCWLDLGLAYEEDATKPDTWIYSYPSGSTENTDSESVVDKTWKVGFLPAAKCPLGSFTADFAKLQATKRDTSLEPKNLFVDITNVDVSYRFDGTNYENCATDANDGAALITSSKTGKTDVYGQIALAADTCKVTYYDALGDLQSFNTVGVNKYAVNASTFGEDIDLGGKILYTMNWVPGNWASEFTHPYGNRVYKEQDTKVYFRLHDKNGNAIIGKEIDVTATFNNAEYTEFSATTATDENGLIEITVPRPSREGQLVFNVEVAEGVLKTNSTPITYVNKDASVEALKVSADPVFDKDNTKKITLTFNNQITDTVLTDAMLKKLFVVKDKDDKVLEIDTVTVNLKTVVITLKNDSFIENEAYSVEVMTGEEVKIDGIVYVMYDANGQAMLTENAKKEFTVKY